MWCRNGLIFITVVSQLSGATAAGAADSINARQREAITETIIPAYQASALASLSEPLTKLASGLHPSQVDDVDQLFTASGLPSLAQVLLNVRVFRAQQDGQLLTPQPPAREALLLLSALVNNLRGITQEVAELPALAEPMPHPETVAVSAEFVGSLTVAYDRLTLARQLADAVPRLQKACGQVNRSSFSADQAELVAGNFTDLTDSVPRLQQLCREHELELRCRGIELAVAVLGESSATLDRWQAARFLDVNAAAIEPLLLKAKKPRSDQTGDDLILDAPLAQSTLERIRLGREKAGELTIKSQLFFDGLECWLRGRYGRGPEFFGLVKSQAAMRSPAARYHVYMPPDIEPAEGPQTPSSQPLPYDGRRHHYHWAWEERSLQTSRDLVLPSASSFPVSPDDKGRQGRLYLSRGVPSGPAQFLSSYTFSLGRSARATPTAPASGAISSRSRPASDPRTTSPSSPSPYASRTHIPEQSREALYRLVGFFEYTGALENLDGLVSRCTPDELQLLDDWFKDRTEFAVKTNLSQSVEQQPSPLSEAPAAPGDAFERRGLAWVMALARVELAAMLVGFGNQPTAFVDLVRGDFDRAAYRELLLDGARTHHWALQEDPAVRLVLAGQAPLDRLLAYQRRCRVAGALLNASEQLGAAVNGAQKMELAVWRKGVTELLTVVTTHLDGMNTTTRR